MTQSILPNVRCNPLSPEEVFDLIKRSQNGCVESRNKIIEGNIKLVINIVHRYKGKEHMMEDLFQIGVIGLMKAIDNFDLGKNVRFSTYAVPMIIGEIRRHLRDHGHSVKVSRMIQEHATKIFAFREEFVAKNQREPRVSEISEQLDLDSEDIILAMGVSNEVVSLSKPVQGMEDDNVILEDKISDKSNWEESFLQREYLREAFKTLSKKEQCVVEMRYFQEKTQSQVGEALGISQVQVSRIEKTALKKLRNVM